MRPLRVRHRLDHLDHDPQNNQTNMRFQGVCETQRQIYQGRVSPSNLLETVNTSYNNSTSPCTGATIICPSRGAPSSLNSRAACNPFTSITTIPSGSSQTNTTMITARGGSNPLNREVDITFAALGDNINAFKQTVTVKDGTGNIEATTTYNYDETYMVAPPNNRLLGAPPSLALVETSQALCTL